MVVPMLDERPHFVAVKAAIGGVDALLGAATYDYGQVPGEDGNVGTVPESFVLLQFERMFVEPAQGSRMTSRTGWRLSVRGVGTTVNNARLALFQVATALDSVRLVINGKTSTPLQHDGSDAPRADDGLFSGVSSWTYCL